MHRRLAARLLVAAALFLANVLVSETMAGMVADLPVAGEGCPAGGGGPRVVYLSEQNPEIDQDGFCSNAQQVQSIIFQIGQTGTLVVDLACRFAAGLRLPSRFTLKGLGIGSVSQISFTHDGIGLSICQEEPKGYVTIADLDLYGPNPAGAKIVAPHATGIALANQNIVYITNVRVSNFITGISGRNSFSVFINGSNISDNRGDNVRIGYGSNGWRIRDGLVSQAGGWGINVRGPGDDDPLEVVENGLPVTIEGSNDLLIDGVRIESNAGGAIRTDTYGVRITNSRFELNGLGNSQIAILADEDAQETRILTNLFSGNCIDNRSISTQRAFNIPASLNNTETKYGLGVQCP